MLLYDSLGLTADSLEQKKQLDALRQVYAEYQRTCETGSIALWKNFRQPDAYLISELFSQERKLLGQTQEEFAYRLEMDPKTISRIECGKYNPKPGTYEKLKEQLSLDRDICSTRIVTQDFELLELERAVAKAIHFRNYTQAKSLYMQLRPKLSIQYNENRQYIKYTDTMFAETNHTITLPEAISLYTEAFQITRRNLPWEQLDKITLGRTETFLVNSIAICHYQLKQYEKAIFLREKVLAGYQKSRFSLKHHYAGASILYRNLSMDYEGCGDFDKVISCCENGILLELDANRAGFLGFLIEQKAYAEEMKGKSKGESKPQYLRAYHILKLTKKEASLAILKRYYQRNYQETLD